MTQSNLEKEKVPMTWINILSILIPVAVALLLGIQSKVDLGTWTKVLPHAIGIINSLTAILLLLGLYFIKKKQIENHRKAMSAAFVLGFLFLLCYITYHISNEATHYGNKESALYPIYLVILISHIGLSLVVLPFVLRAMFFAQTRQFERHRKVVRFAYPFWLYVSVTGVIAYLMISPYYK